MIPGIAPFSAALLITPTNNSRVILNNWWVIDAHGNAFMHERFGTPQCNSQREVLELVYPTYEHRFISIAYFDPDKALSGGGAA
jgi:hypothetical protein